MIAPVLALATPGMTKASPIGTQAPSSPGVFGALLALLLVLGLILALGWLLKRIPGHGPRGTQDLQVVASVMLGAKERVVVIQVNGQQLLLGVTAASIRTLHTLPNPLPQRSVPALSHFKQFPNFAQLFSQKLRKDS